ncbi:MAG: sialate O-acetylesterase [Kiritimatiellia bacterium]|jgi:sialate O-acetylesterase|nr:sialate O-acetylesterase [Kiritimatiellia bacterium]
MMRRIGVLLAVLVVMGSIRDVEAKVAVSGMFGDNMVLQCDMKVPVWGTADADEKVVVEFSGQKKETVADKDGKWMLHLDPVKTTAKEGVLTVKSGTDNQQSPISFSNVLVGEVWLGSGQSNMAGGTGGYAKNDPVLKQMATGGPYPTLRLYGRNGWQVADENSIRGFSAIHFAFGRNLHKELNVPVGLMVGAVGGTPSGRWLTEEMAAADPALVKMLQDNTDCDSVADIGSNYEELKKQYDAEAEKAKAEGKKPGRAPRRAVIGDLYERHIAHKVPYGIRGVLWDQGESRTQIPGVDQITTMHALIEGWRNAWNQPSSPEGSGAPEKDFHFMHVQKPSGEGCAWDYENPVNRLAIKFDKLPAQHVDKPSALKYQLDHIKIATLKNAPIVTASDLAGGIHPQNKSGYGKRACRVALGSVYGKDVAICGPVYKAHKVEGKTIRIEYNHVGKGLAFKHGETLQGFEIAGADGKWDWAEAKIDGNTVVVTSENIAEPVNVQYAFNRRHNFANLFNKDGLPALMFTSVEH